MTQRQAGTIELLVVIVAAAVLFHLGVTAVLAAVPLQVVRRRRGEAWFVYAAILAVVAIAVVRIGTVVAAAGGPWWPGALDVLVAAGLVGGVWIADAPRLGGLRRHLRLVIGGVVAGVATVPVFALVSADETFRATLDAQLALFEELFFLPVEAEAGLPPGTGGRLLTAEAVLSLARDLYYGTVAFAGVLMVSGNAVLGDLLARTIRPPEGVTVSTPRLKAADFSVPERTVWVLILGLGGLLAGNFVDLGPVGYLFRNAAYIAGLLFAVQGIGIIATYWRLAGTSRGVRTGIILLAVVALFVPPANTILILGITGLGVAEIWVRIRQRLKEKYDEGHP